MPLGTEVVLGPGRIVLHGDPAPPHGKGHSSPPATFRPMSTVAKRLPIAGTAELLYGFLKIMLMLVPVSSRALTVLFQWQLR